MNRTRIGNDNPSRKGHRGSDGLGRNHQKEVAMNATTRWSAWTRLAPVTGLLMLVAMVATGVAVPSTAYAYGNAADCQNPAKGNCVAAGCAEACKAAADAPNKGAALAACNLAAHGVAAVKDACRVYVGSVGSAASAPAAAAAATVICHDGSTAANLAACPSRAGRVPEIRCLNRTRQYTKSDCAVVDCPDGYTGRGRTIGDCTKVAPPPAEEEETDAEETSTAPAAAPGLCPENSSPTRKGRAIECTCYKDYEWVGEACLAVCDFGRREDGACMGENEALCGKAHASPKVDAKTGARKCTTGEKGKITGCDCACDEGFEAFDDQCLPACKKGQKRHAGTSQCADTPWTYCGADKKLVTWVWEGGEWKWDCMAVARLENVEELRAQVNTLRKVLFGIGGGLGLLLVLLVASRLRRGPRRAPPAANP